MPAQTAHKYSTDDNVYYHVYNKGVDDKIIFRDKDDYSVFLGFLQEYLTPFNPEDNKKDFMVNGQGFRGLPHQPKNYFNKIELLVYNLNPNHFHLVLHQATSGSLVAFMRSLSTRYSIYFNGKYRRRGSLFEGPYKSTNISTIPQLCLLTCFLHQEDGWSSHPEYLGSRVTAWVKPDIVISYLNQNNISYQNYIENHQFDEKEKESLNEIVLENISHDNIQPPVPEMEKSDPIPRSKPRTPEFFLLSMIFVDLLGLGLLNIQKTSASNIKNQISISETSQVLSKSDNQRAEKPNPTPTNPGATPLSTQINIEDINTTSSAHPTPNLGESQKVTMVRVSDGPKSVNILKNPSSTSEIVGQAVFGETFELIDINEGWCEVKLANGSIGFISSNYIDVIGTGK